MQRNTCQERKSAYKEHFQFNERDQNIKNIVFEHKWAYISLNEPIWVYLPEMSLNELK